MTSHKKHVCLSLAFTRKFFVWIVKFGIRYSFIQIAYLVHDPRARLSRNTHSSSCPNFSHSSSVRNNLSHLYVKRRLRSSRGVRFFGSTDLGLSCAVPVCLYLFIVSKLLTYTY